MRKGKADTLAPRLSPEFKVRFQRTDQAAIRFTCTLLHIAQSHHSSTALYTLLQTDRADLIHRFSCESAQEKQVAS